MVTLTISYDWEQLSLCRMPNITRGSKSQMFHTLGHVQDESFSCFFWELCLWGLFRNPQNSNAEVFIRLMRWKQWEILYSYLYHSSVGFLIPIHNQTRTIISTRSSIVPLKGHGFYLFIIFVIVHDVSWISPRSHLMEGPALFLLTNAFLMISCSKCYGEVSLIAGRALESHHDNLTEVKKCYIEIKSWNIEHILKGCNTLVWWYFITWTSEIVMSLMLC